MGSEELLKFDIPLTVTLHRENGAWWSEVAEHPGCLASGRTIPEWGEALGEALGMVL